MRSRLDAFITTTGLNNFIYTLNGGSGDDSYSSSSSNYPRYISSSYVSSLPSGCQADDYGYYQAIGCSSKGEFLLETFSDAYCSKRVETADKLKKLNELLNAKTTCHKISNETLNSLLTASDSCSTIDYKACATAYGKKGISPMMRMRHYPFATPEERVKLGLFLLACSGILVFMIIIQNRSYRYQMAHLRRQRRKYGHGPHESKRQFNVVFRDKRPVYT